MFGFFDFWGGINVSLKLNKKYREFLKWEFIGFKHFNVLRIGTFTAVIIIGVKLVMKIKLLTFL
jgi:hypothetical protein